MSFLDYGNCGSYLPCLSSMFDDSYRDVPNVRKILPDLTDTAPETIKKPFMKTTKILLAYDIEIEVRVKDGSDTSLASLLRSRDLSILGVQITEESIRNGVASIRGGNGRFPVLLAVLAAQC